MDTQRYGGFRTLIVELSLLTIVVPTLNEANTLPGLLGDLAGLDLPCRIVVADGGSTDGTDAMAKKAGVSVITSDPGRAKQMNKGATCCDSEWLLFLHADARLPSNARNDLRTAIAHEPTLEVAVWRLRIGSPRTVYRLIEFGALVRDRLFGLPYGDQGLLIRSQLFKHIGGFSELPVMEDVAIVRAVRGETKIHRFSSNVVVSSRRWERYGPIRSSLRNLLLVSAFYVGVPPHRLSNLYPPESR